MVDMGGTVVDRRAVTSWRVHLLPGISRSLGLVAATGGCVADSRGALTKISPGPL